MVGERLVDPLFPFMRWYLLAGARAEQDGDCLRLRECGLDEVEVALVEGLEVANKEGVLI